MCAPHTKEGGTVLCPTRAPLLKRRCWAVAADAITIVDERNLRVHTEEGDTACTHGGDTVCTLLIAPSVTKEGTHRGGLAQLVHEAPQEQHCELEHPACAPAPGMVSDTGWSQTRDGLRHGVIASHERRAVVACAVLRLTSAVGLVACGHAPQSQLAYCMRTYPETAAVWQ